MGLRLGLCPESGFVRTSSVHPSSRILPDLRNRRRRAGAMAPPRSCALALLFLAGISLTLAATIPTPVITNVVPGNQRVTIYFNRIPDQSPPLQQMAVNCLDTRITVDPKNVDRAWSFCRGCTWRKENLCVLIL